MPQKTNAARFLDQMGIIYELREYEVDPEDLGAQAVAIKIGQPPEQLFKTLVAQGDRHGICIAPPDYLRIVNARVAAIAFSRSRAV